MAFFLFIFLPLLIWYTKSHHFYIILHRLIYFNEKKSEIHLQCLLFHYDCNYFSNSLSINAPLVYKVYLSMIYTIITHPCYTQQVHIHFYVEISEFTSGVLLSLRMCINEKSGEFWIAICLLLFFCVCFFFLSVCSLPIFSYIARTLWCYGP